MKEYGYINEYGYLVSKFVDGEKDQMDLVSLGYKPVELVDETKLVCDERGYTIYIVPYDAGLYIGYMYEKRFNPKLIIKEIDELKNELETSDYKIIKCYEASLLDNPLPYDAITLHNERQIIRNKINELEDQVSRIQKD